MIALTFRPARGWSSDCRGHLGRNATILPVIKLLIRLQRTDFGSSFKESPPPPPPSISAHCQCIIILPVTTGPEGDKPLLALGLRDWGFMWSSSLAFYTSARLKQGKSSLDGNATPWKLLSAFLDITLSGKSCSATCVGYQPEDRRDDFLIFLVLYLRSTALMSSGTGGDVFDGSKNDKLDNTCESSILWVHQQMPLRQLNCSLQPRTELTLPSRCLLRNQPFE